MCAPIYLWNTQSFCYLCQGAQSFRWWAAAHFWSRLVFWAFCRHPKEACSILEVIPRSIFVMTPSTAYRAPKWLFPGSFWEFITGNLVQNIIFLCIESCFLCSCCHLGPTLVTCVCHEFTCLLAKVRGNLHEAIHTFFQVEWYYLWLRCLSMCFGGL